MALKTIKMKRPRFKDLKRRGTLGGGLKNVKRGTKLRLVKDRISRTTKYITQKEFNRHKKSGNVK